MFEEEDIFNIKPSSENFETWSNKNFVKDDIKDLIKNSSVLIVPSIGFRDTTTPTFPPFTSDILFYLKEHITQEYDVEICADDENFATLALHSDYKRLGKFVVKQVALPLFLSVFGGYIVSKITAPEQGKTQITINNNIINSPSQSPHVIKKQRIRKKSPHKYLEPSKITFTITVVDSAGNSIEYHYEGPAEGAPNIIDKIKNSTSDEH